MLFPLRPCVPMALAMLCCACSTPEERADAAFGEMSAVVRQLEAELAGITDEESAVRALPKLEELAERLRELLSLTDELAQHEDMSPEARRRVGEAHHAPLQEATEAALLETVRLGRRELYHVEGLKRLARREYAHYSAKGVHPWARAVLQGREYKPKKARNRKD